MGKINLTDLLDSNYPDKNLSLFIARVERTKVPQMLLAAHDVTVYQHRADNTPGTLPKEVAALFEKAMQSAKPDPRVYQPPDDLPYTGIVPDEVIALSEAQELFKNPPTVLYDGWVWKKFPGGRGNRDYYQRNRYVRTEIVMRQVDPYLNLLAGLEGKVITPSEFAQLEAQNSLMPLTKAKPYEYFDIHGTRFKLRISESERRNDGCMIATMNLSLIYSSGPDLGRGRALLFLGNYTIAKVDYRI